MPPSYFVVTRGRGPAWDTTRPMRDQDDWPKHAQFMDALAVSGFIVLGGPLGDDDTHFMHVCAAENAAAARERFEDDPWTPSMLEIESAERWTILLESPESPVSD